MTSTPKVTLLQLLPSLDASSTERGIVEGEFELEPSEKSPNPNDRRLRRKIG